MIMSNILNIQHSQNEYHDLVVHFNKLFCIENPSFKIISKFLYYQGWENTPFSGVRNYPILRDNK